MIRTFRAEFVKLWKYRADPSKPTYVHPTLR